MDTSLFPGRWENRFPLRKLCTWRIGGEADRVYWPSDAAALRTFLDVCLREDHPVFILGRGSNVLMPDQGYGGTVVALTDMSGVEWFPDGVKAEGGYSLMRLAREAAKRGLGGLEFAWGIPGTVGAAAVINAGAHGGEMSQVICRADVLVREDETYVERRLAAEEIRFGYRDSSLKEWHSIVTAVEFALMPGMETTSLDSQGKEVMERRRGSQPLEYPNAGSVFRNPPGDFASRLIEEAGWKGRFCGGAQVSEKHVNFIVNRREATAADVRTLISGIRQDVLGKFGVELKTEVIVVDGKL